LLDNRPYGHGKRLTIGYERRIDGVISERARAFGAMRRSFPSFEMPRGAKGERAPASAINQEIYIKTRALKNATDFDA
jgi:hypothetical protein